MMEGVQDTNSVQPSTATGDTAEGAQTAIAPADAAAGQQTQRQAWDYAEEINNILKTAHPLLALTLETISDQLVRFKVAADEEIYRYICALLHEAIQVSRLKLLKLS